MNLFPDDILPSDARLEEFEVNYTPIGVVRQGLYKFKELHPNEKITRILDVGAGNGVWCKVAREVWREARITAVEVREEERASLERVANRVLIQPFSAADFEPGEFDLVIGNPPFSLTRQWVREIATRKIADYLLFYDKVQAFQRSADGVALMQEHMPSQEYRVAQSVNHRSGGSGDGICYCHWVWDLLDKSDRWTCYQLPCLPSSERRH